jgi:hypothetical protein
MIFFCQMVVQSIRWLVNRFDGVILHKSEYKRIISQRDQAVTTLVKTEGLKLTQGLVGVVFSRDRALQLYTLLHTYFAKVRVPAPLYVIYSASSNAHAKSYQEISVLLRAGCWDVRLINEGDEFRNTLLDTLSQINTKNMFFLVDDDVFIREVDLSISYQLDPFNAILSLRHSPHLRRSYTANAEQSPPQFSSADEDDGLSKFAWFEQGYEWSDPWSVDGHVLSTAEVRVMAGVSDFKAPNTFETALKSFNTLCKNRFGLCYSESKVVNLPINQVQIEVSNLSGNISTDFLLARWNDGMMFDVRPLEHHIPLSPHEEHRLEFVKRTPFNASEVGVTMLGK